MRICSKAAQSSKISRVQDLAIYNSGHGTYLLFITHIIFPYWYEYTFFFAMVVFLNSKIRLSLYWIMLSLKLLKTEKEEIVGKYGQMKVLVQGHSPSK